MKKQTRNVTLVFGALLVFGAGISLCQPTSPGSTEKALPLTEKTKAWESDPRFSAVRQKIETEMGKQVSVASANASLKKYSKLAHANRKDSLLQFQWGMAALRQAQIAQSMTNGEMFVALDAMKKTPEPRNYEYARLSFILALATSSEKGPTLRNVGLRLYAENLDDKYINYYLVDVLNYDKPEDRKLALEVLGKFLKSYGDEPNTYALIGQVNFRLWLATGDKIYGGKSIAAYDKHMAMTDVDEIGKRQIAFVTNRIKSGKR